jgi:hypothetical protein
MKYLSNRDEFLKRSIKKIDEYKSYEGLVKINEDVENSGPFANDIPWGDSLLGRLINSTIRKAKVGANLVRIKGVAKRLRYAFDDLLGGSAEAELSEEDKKEFKRLTVFSFLDSLQKAVEEEASVGDIKNLTKAAISDIKSFDDFENKDSLISQLEEFLKFLEQFKDDEGGKSEADADKEEGEGESKEGEGEEGDKEGEGEGESSNSSESMYPTMIKILKSLTSVLSNYKAVKMPEASKQSSEQKDKKLKYITVAGDTVEKIQKNPKANLKKLTTTDIRTKNNQVLAKYPKDNQTMPAGLVLVMESYTLLEAIGDGASPDRANIKGGEDHLTQAFTKLKKAIEVLESPKDKGVGVDVKFLNDITSKSLDSKNKEVIKSLFVEINRYLVGDKKETLNASATPLYKESMEIISDKNKKIVVAEKIARFAKTALQFDKEGLYGGLGETGKGLQSFVEGIKSTMTMKATDKKPEVKTEEKPKEEVKKESSLFKYDKFISLLKEAEEGEESKEGEDESKVGAPDVMTTSQKIKDYWKKKIDIKAFVMEKTEVIKMKEKFDKIEKERKDSIVINGIDPVLDIVKCFNRAYKIHTTQVISSGRSGGRVSNGVFMEYTCFGSGDPSNAGKSGGPYRNNAIFNQWENTVLDIQRDKKYQPIFNIGTKLKVGNDLIDKAGANLRKFMTDMLDGDELYKTSSGKDSQGLQAKFLDKYFGYKEDDPNKTNFGGSEEQENNSKIADAIPGAKNLLFTKDPIKFESNDDLAKSFFAVSTNKSVVYFFIQEVVGDIAYITYSSSFYFFQKYITESAIPNKLSQGDLPRAVFLNKVGKEQIDKDGKESTLDYKIKATKKKIDNLIGKDGKFKLTGDYEITYLTKFDGKSNNANTKSTLSDKPEVIDIVNCYTLYENTKDVETASGKTRFVLDKKIGDRISTIGGFKTVSGADNISKTKMEKK